MLLVTTWALSLWSVYYGTATIVGGKQRWAAAAYETALLVPGAPESWGITLLLGGVISIIGWLTHSRILLIIGSGIGFFWSIGFAISLMITLAGNPTVGFGGFGTYILLAVMFGMRTGLFVSWRR
jgi:hypothetical protein